MDSLHETHHSSQAETDVWVGDGGGGLLASL